MITALTYVAGSVIFLAFLTFVYVIEDIKGERFFLKGARSWLDAFLIKLSEKIISAGSFFGNSFVRLLLHYGVHSILNGVLGWLKRLEGKVENLVRRNRQVAKKIQATKVRNHLDAIAEHREETALSDSQKEEMLTH